MPDMKESDDTREAAFGEKLADIEGLNIFFFFSSRRRHTRYWRDWSSDVCSSDLIRAGNYKAIETTAYGDREMEKAEVITYKGKLNDDANSEVRFTLTDKVLEGFIDRKSVV